MWVQIAMLVVSFIISYVLSRPANVKAAAFDDIQIPQSAEGTAQAMDFGTCWTPDWMVLGTANFRTRAIRKRPSKLAKKQTIGHEYYMDLLMGYGRGECDAILRIKIGDREAWQGYVTGNDVIRIDKPDLFGGTGSGGMGGVVGDLHIQMGAPDQARHPLLVAAFGPMMSAARGVCTGFFTGQICAMTPNPEMWELQRTTILKGWDGSPWYPALATIPLPGVVVPAMNPAHILMKVLTHRDCGRGLSTGRIDLAAFAAAADTLRTEGFGLCLRWNRQVSVREFLQQVCDHIGASQYVSRTTGLLTLSLARGGYDIDDIPVFNADSGLIEIEEDDNPTGWGATNEVIVEWRDPNTNEARQVRWQNLAAIQAYGRVSETLKYPGLPTAALANRVAQRDGAIRSSGSKRFRLVFDRRGYQIEPAGLVRIQAPEHGIADMVLRVGDIQDGTLSDGRIRVVALQDVFGMDATSYVADAPSTHVEPDRTPGAAQDRLWTEASYRDLVLELGAGDLAALATDRSMPMMMARRPSGMATGYDLVTRVGSAPFALADEGSWCPTATVVEALPKSEAPVTVTISAGSELHEVEVGEAAIIDAEILRVDAIDLTDGTLTLARGCVDTVPAEHSAGSRVWFPDSGGALDPTTYGSVAVDAKVLTRTSTGALTEALAPTDSIALTARQGRPYVPGRFRINGQAYPATSFARLAIAIAHRDRLSQAGQLVDSAAVSIGPEPGTTWTVRIYRQPTTLLHTEAGLTGADFTWLADVDADLRVEVEAVRGGVVSRQKYVHALTVEGASKVSNGTFASDTAWAKGAGWTISGGAANKAAGTASDLTQAGALVASGSYLVEYTLSNVTAGTLRARFDGGTATNGATRTADGVYSETLVAKAGNATVALGADAAFVGRVDNVSVRRVA